MSKIRKMSPVVLYSTIFEGTKYSGASKLTKENLSSRIFGGTLEGNWKVTSRDFKVYIPEAKEWHRLRLMIFFLPESMKEWKIPFDKVVSDSQADAIRSYRKQGWRMQELIDGDCGKKCEDCDHCEDDE